MRVVGNPRLEFILINTYGVNLTVNDTLTTMMLSPSSVNGPIACGAVFPPGNWAVGANKTFTCLFPLADYVRSQRYDGVIEINFVQQGGMYTHTVRGTVSTVAQ